MSELISTDLNYNGRQIVDDLNRLLRLRTTPIGMKLFESVAEMAAIERIRRPQDIHTTDQIVGQAARNGWTVGITAADLVGAQCSTVLGLHPRDDQWLSGDRMNGVWFGSQQDAAAHQQAMDVVEHGKYEAMAVSPLASGRLNPPDICLIYATPAQMILFINGLQYHSYRRYDFTLTGESACADSWGRALSTRETSLALPCYAERRYGGVADDELLMACPPDEFVRGVEGMKHLSKNGLRYPYPPYSAFADPADGMSKSYS